MTAMTVLPGTLEQGSGATAVFLLHGVGGGKEVWELDRNASPMVMQRMSGRIAGAHYQCLPAVGHLANMEQPDAFNAAVLSFLQTHFPA